MKNNAELTDEERDRQMDRIDGFPLGTTHADKQKQQNSKREKNPSKSVDADDLLSRLNDRLSKDF